MTNRTHNLNQPKKKSNYEKKILIFFSSHILSIIVCKSETPSTRVL